MLRVCRYPLAVVVGLGTTELQCSHVQKDAWRGQSDPAVQLAVDPKDKVVMMTERKPPWAPSSHLNTSWTQEFRVGTMEHRDI